MSNIDQVIDKLFEVLYNGPDHYSCAVGAYNSAYFALEYDDGRANVAKNCEFDYEHIIEALVYIIDNPHAARLLVREYNKHLDFN